MREEFLAGEFAKVLSYPDDVRDPENNLTKSRVQLCDIDQFKAAYGVQLANGGKGAELTKQI